LAALEEDARLVSGQLALALLFRSNSKFILGRAVEAPTTWLYILSAADGDVYVG